MRGYRRFVAYVYEYRRGRKEENCGYVRVEARDDNCSVEVHLMCPGLPGQVRGEVYGFIRDREQIEGYLLHQCQTLQDGMECSFETETDRLGENQVTLADLGGMVIRTEGGAFFGTEWDDQPIRPDMFFIHTEVSEEPPEAVETEPKSGTDQSVIEYVPEIKETPEAEKEAPAAGDDLEAAENREIEGPEVIREEQTEGEEISSGSEKIVVLKERQEAQSELSETRESPVLNRDEILQAQHCEEAFDPFPDGSVLHCRKIHVNELYRLHPRDRGLQNNRFVAYSYQQFGFLLIGRLADGRYILGLPGGYDRQERFMAGTFGFPYFKESPKIELPKTRGGFWYRLINAPDFNDGDGLS